MTDFAAARHNMVESQIRPNRANEPRLIEAFGAVPREVFVPAALQGVAYVDEDIEVARGRYLIEPRVLARMLHEASIKPTDKVLDIGVATGYSAAILARVAGRVVALESDPGLAGKARATLEALGAGNVMVVTGPLEAGCPGEAPFDVILFQGSVAHIPPAIAQQLGEGGRLVAVVGEGPVATARLYGRIEGRIGQRPLFDAGTHALPGFAVERGFVF